MTAPEHAQDAARHDPARGASDGLRPPSSGATRFVSAAERRDARLGGASATAATWSLRFLLLVAALAVLAWVVGRLWVIVLPVLLAALLATVLWPPVRLLRRYVPDVVAALAVLLAGLGVLTGLVIWIVPQVADQTDDLAAAASGGLQNLQDIITAPPFNLGEDQVGNVVGQVRGWLEDNAQTIAGGLLSGVSTLGSILVGTLLAVVVCFFMLKDGPRFIPWISGLAGPRAAPHLAQMARRSWVALSGFIRAQATVGLVDAVAIGTGLVVLGVPLALPLSILTFFGAFIPIIGATVTGVLAALVALVSNGVTSALIVIVIVLVVQQLEGNVLQPYLVGSSLNLHPVLVLLGVTAGGSLFGIIGALLAVPVVAVATAMVRYGREQLDAPLRQDATDAPPPVAETH